MLFCQSSLIPLLFLPGSTKPRRIKIVYVNQSISSVQFVDDFILSYEETESMDDCASFREELDSLIDDHNKAGKEKQCC